jgi:hypothetical protein
MPIQTIDRGTAGDTGDKFKAGVAFDTCQANDDYLELNKVGTVATFAALASTAATVGQIVKTASHTSDGIGGGDFEAYAATHAATDGGININSATVGIRFRRINYSDITVEMFGALGDGVTDDTAEIQLAINYIGGRQGYQTIDGAVTGGYVSTALPLHFYSSKYLIGDTLACPSYFIAIGYNSVITQSNSAKDIFSCATAYQWDIRGFNFSKGRHQLYLENNNIDVTRWNVEGCTFSLSYNYAIKTWPTLGATSHLSAILQIKNCAFYKPKQILLNYCDNATIEDSWVFVSKDNFTANTAVFVNASTTSDGFPKLNMKNMFGVPSMGTQGVDRLANVRWIDLNKGGISAVVCRFGGEFAGMPTIYNYAAPSATTPFIGASILVDDCLVSSGPSAASDSGIVVLNGQIPNSITIINNAGAVEAPYVINYAAGIASFPTYFSNYETATGRKAWELIKIKIDNNQSFGSAGTIYFESIPSGIRNYVNNFRQTKISRATTQVLANAFANNYVSFSTVAHDTQGGFAIANPTRILMPPGATRLRVNVYMNLDGGWTGNTLGARLENSSAVIVAAWSIATNANADNTAYTFTAEVEGIAGEYYQLNVQQNSAAGQNLIGCVVTTSAVDFIY